MAAHRVFTALTWIAITLWLLAQALPAFAIVPDDFICSAWPRWDPPETCDVRGILPTLAGWAMFLDDVVAGVAWAANLFFGLALLARSARGHVPAIVSSLMAVTCGLLAMAVVGGAIGGTAAGLGIRSVGVGSWVWLTSMIVLAISVSGWALTASAPLTETGEAGEVRRHLITRVAIGYAALVGACVMAAAVWAIALEALPIGPPTPTPVPGTIEVGPTRLPAEVRFDGGSYRVEACLGDQVLMDGEPRGTPPFEIEIEAGRHEIDGELRRCTITFIPIVDASTDPE